MNMASSKKQKTIRAEEEFDMSSPPTSKPLLVWDGTELVEILPCYKGWKQLKFLFVEVVLEENDGMDALVWLLGGATGIGLAELTEYNCFIVPVPASLRFLQLNDFRMFQHVLMAKDHMITLLNNSSLHDCTNMQNIMLIDSYLGTQPTVVAKHVQELEELIVYGGIGLLDPLRLLRAVPACLNRQIHRNWTASLKENAQQLFEKNEATHLLTTMFRIGQGGFLLRPSWPLAPDWVEHIGAPPKVLAYVFESRAVVLAGGAVLAAAAPITKVLGMPWWPTRLPGSDVDLFILESQEADEAGATLRLLLSRSGYTFVRTGNAVETGVAPEGPLRNVQLIRSISSTTRELLGDFDMNHTRAAVVDGQPALSVGCLLSLRSGEVSGEFRVQQPGRLHKAMEQGWQLPLCMMELKGDPTIETAKVVAKLEEVKEAAAQEDVPTTPLHPLTPLVRWENYSDNKEIFTTVSVTVDEMNEELLESMLLEMRVTLRKHIPAARTLFLPLVFRLNNVVLSFDSVIQTDENGVVVENNEPPQNEIETMLRQIRALQFSSPEHATKWKVLLENKIVKQANSEWSCMKGRARVDVRTRLQMGKTRIMDKHGLYLPNQELHLPAKQPISCVLKAATIFNFPGQFRDPNAQAGITFHFISMRLR
jgi:hypothetical protein